MPVSRFQKEGVCEFVSVLKSGEFKKRVLAMDGFVVPEDILDVVVVRAIIPDVPPQNYRNIHNTIDRYE